MSRPHDELTPAQHVCGMSEADPVAAEWRPLVAGLMLVALLLRLSAALAVESYVHNQGRRFLIEGDANGYWQLAEKIAAGEDYAIHQPPRYVLRTPGFPLFLAACIRLFGNSVLAARVALAFAGTLACWLTYCLGRRLHMRRTGFWAALFVAVNPLHVGTSVLILSETLFAVPMLASLLFLHRLLANGRAATDKSGTTTECRGARLLMDSGLAGLLIGLAALVRPGFLPWLMVAAVLSAGWMTCAARWIRWGCISMMLAGCVTILFPWAYRNYSVTGHWVVTSLWAGPSLYDGLNPEADGSSNMEFFDREAVMRTQQMTEFEMNAHYRDRAIEFAKRHPWRAFVLALRKSGRFLSPVPHVSLGASKWPEVLCGLLFAVFYLCVVIGLWTRQLSFPEVVITIGPFLLFLALHMAFVGSVRYRLPAEYPLAVVAAIGWRHVVLRRSKQARFTERSKLPDGGPVNGGSVNGGPADG